MDLNKDCHCISIDTDAISRQFMEASVQNGLDAGLLASHKTLFASVPVYLAQEHVHRMQEVVWAIESVAALPAYRELAYQQSPAIAAHATKAAGVFFGYDFHLGAAGPKLIEINTNAGGALLNVLLARAQRVCCAEMQALAVGPVELLRLEETFVQMFAREFVQNHPTRTLGRVAIVDVAPREQFLYPEFMLFKALFERHGVQAAIAAPEELAFDGQQLSYQGRAIDLVYNRSTDFYLDTPSHAALRDAYLANAVVVTPHPQAHALFANKMHLVHLSDAGLLKDFGVPQATIDLLLAHVPKARHVVATEGESFWAQRKGYFFKPLTGYGSKAAYRGDKLTKSTFAHILTRDYIAQELVPPSERMIEVNGTRVPLKLDVRNYVYNGHVQLLAARLYHGQTTNFRTEGGGFAPVYTNPPDLKLGIEC